MTDSIKVGVVADQTGPLSFVGIANANVARMVIGDINARGGLLGRHLELLLEDGATDDAVAAAAARKLVADHQVDVIFGGIYSSTRQAFKEPAVVEGKTLYIYPEQYEGQESDPLIFCTGPVPAQQVDPFIPWMMRETGARRLYLPSADYIWPHVMNARIREVVTANGGTIVGEEYFPLDHADYRETVERIVSSGADAVFNTIVPPGVTPPPPDEHVHRAGARRPVRDRRRPRADRSEGAPRRPVRRRSLSAGDPSTATATETETNMLLATTQVEDFDRFLEIFSTKGAQKRSKHGSKGAQVFRDPSEDDRVWVLFDWDEEGWQSFVTDPEVPPIMREAGHKGKPVSAAFAGSFDA